MTNHKKKQYASKLGVNQHGPFGDLSQYPLLSEGEEKELARDIAAGRQAASEIEAAEREGRTLRPAVLTRLTRDKAKGRESRHRLINSNLKLVVHFAKKYDTGFRDFWDICQDGALGLQRAADGFDPDRGFRFSTYATPWIKQAMQRGGQKDRLVRLPEDVYHEFVQLQKFMKDCENDGLGTPSVSDLALEFKKSEARIVDLLAWGQNSESLNHVINEGEDSGCELLDIIAGEGNDFEDEVALRFEVQELMGELRPREERAIGLRLGEGATRAAASSQTGVTPGRIRSIESSLGTALLTGLGKEAQ